MIDVVIVLLKQHIREPKKYLGWKYYCGEKSTQVYDADTWLPDETIEALKEYIVSIKGPLTTPVGGGIRSLNVSLRQILDLYVCLRPIRYFAGVPSPVKNPSHVDMVIFRENSEDIYAGVEFEAGSPESDAMVKVLQEQFGVTQIRFPTECWSWVLSQFLNKAQRDLLNRLLIMLLKMIDPLSHLFIKVIS